MTAYRDDLCREVWRRLPMGKYLIGRARIRELTEMSVGALQPGLLMHCASEQEEEVVAAEAVRSVRRITEAVEYADPITMWSLLLQYLVMAIVQVLIERWRKSARERAELTRWHQEMTS